MTNSEKVNMILEVAEDLGLDTNDFDGLMANGMRFISDKFTPEENRQILIANL